MIPESRPPTEPPAPPSPTARSAGIAVPSAGIFALGVAGVAVAVGLMEVGLALVIVCNLIVVATLAGLALLWLRRARGQRHHTEHALRDSETRHRAILEASLDGIITINERGTVESINPAGQKLFGYAAAEVVGRNISMLMPEPYHSEHDHYLANYLRSGQAKIIGIGREVLGRHKDGSTFPIELAVTQLSLFGRRVFTGTVHDISERKRAEDAIKASEQRFRTIADTIPQMMWTTRSDGHADYSNARWQQYTGMTAEQTMGWGWRQVLHGEDVDRIGRDWGQCVATGSDYAGEARLRASDGTYRWFLIRGVAVHDEGGGIVKWVGTCTDIDDQKHAADREAARVRAESANRAKSEFLANMSHEIRTPMTAILGFADVLLDADQSASDRHNAINVIRRNGAHLLAVINDILDLSKIEAGEMKVEAITCSPCQVLADVASLMRVRAKERGLAFEFKVTGPIPQAIVSDPTRLRQILINLVGNAVKFTEAGWVRLTAGMESAGPSEPARLRFEVIDSGVGMTEEQMSKLFQPFMQADASTTRRFGGTGLGLTISQQLAQALGGRITADSMPGRGSRFVVTIATGPLEGVTMLEDCAEAMVGVESAAAGAAPPTRLRARILLVEDGPDNQALLSAYLRRAGAQVVLAENGKVGWKIVADSLEIPDHPRFDLVLMDMQMPELDGYGATARLRECGYRGPIIALTAHAMATDRQRCLQAGCTDYLSKPVSRADLIAVIRRHLAAADAPASPAPAIAPPTRPAPEAPSRPPANADDDDAVLNKYRPVFIAGLPPKVAALLAGLMQHDLEELRSITHQLAGTAGMYNFPEIGGVASLIEDKLRQAQSSRPRASEGADISSPAAASGGADFSSGGGVGGEGITEIVHTLIELIRAVDGYDRRQEQLMR